MRGKALLAGMVAVLLIPGAAFAQHHEPPPPTDPHPPPPGTFTCTASALRIALLDLEPFVANPQNSPCVDDVEGLLKVRATLFNSVPVEAFAVFAETDANPGGDPGAQSDAGAAKVTIGGISARVLTATATASCQDGEPTLSGSSQVVGLTVNGMPVIATGDPQMVPLGPLGSIFLNEQVEEEDQITVRALRYEGPLSEIVVGEAIADFEGDPCAQ